MEVQFDLAAALGAAPGQAGPSIGVLDEQRLRGHHRRAELLGALDALGKNSAIAQGLKKPVTSGSLPLVDQRVYILADGSLALGLLKVGPKRLFVAAPVAPVGKQERSGVQDALVEINPVCVLDFYVHESCQRSGYGRRLFDEMLRCERLSPARFAYDRPSPKLLGFLRKHFSLTRFRPQNNNYVVFDDYFETPAVGGLSPKMPSTLGLGASGCAASQGVAYSGTALPSAQEELGRGLTPGISSTLEPGLGTSVGVAPRGVACSSTAFPGALEGLGSRRDVLDAHKMQRGGYTTPLPWEATASGSELTGVSAGVRDQGPLGPSSSSRPFGYHLELGGRPPPLGYTPHKSRDLSAAFDLSGNGIGGSRVGTGLAGDARHALPAGRASSRAASLPTGRERQRCASRGSSADGSGIAAAGMRSLAHAGQRLVLG